MDCKCCWVLEVTAAEGMGRARRWQDSGGNWFCCVSLQIKSSVVMVIVSVKAECQRKGLAGVVRSA